MHEKHPIPGQLLFDPETCCEFEPFQAIRMLELIANDAPVRDTMVAWKEIEQAIRFRANVTLAFPPSLIAQVIPPAENDPDPTEFKSSVAEKIRRRYKRGNFTTFVGNFFGLFGPNGALPINYTQTLCELELLAETRNKSTRTALRDWFDLFNNRMTALLFRAWQKYRMPVGYLRYNWRRLPNVPSQSTDRITQSLFSTIGLGTPALRDRIRVLPPPDPNQVGNLEGQEALARIEDRALLAYVGAFARRRAGAHELRAILADYFDLPFEVQTLTGQWLDLPKNAQSKLDDGAGSGRLGINTVAGEKIWDSGSKFRLRIGPLRYREFVDMLPDPTSSRHIDGKVEPVVERKGVYLLSQLTRLYVGAELDFEIQLVLHSFEVPDCVIQEVPEGGLGLRLGWNSWLKSDDMPPEVDDMRFDAPNDVVLPSDEWQIGGAVEELAAPPA